MQPVTFGNGLQSVSNEAVAQRFSARGNVDNFNAADGVPIAWQVSHDYRSVVEQVSIARQIGKICVGEGAFERGFTNVAVT